MLGGLPPLHPSKLQHLVFSPPAGKYKSAGDQLLRRDMSEAQAEQLSALLDDIYTRFTQTVASARGKSEQEVRRHTMISHDVAGNDFAMISLAMLSNSFG